MRASFEITHAQRMELRRLAAQRGKRGISSLLREALDLYLSKHRAKRDAAAKALALEGTFGAAETVALEVSVKRLRKGWR